MQKQLANLLKIIPACKGISGKECLVAAPVRATPATVAATRLVHVHLSNHQPAVPNALLQTSGSNVRTGAGNVSPVQIIINQAQHPSSVQLHVHHWHQERPWRQTLPLLLGVGGVGAFLGIAAAPWVSDQRSPHSPSQQLTTLASASGYGWRWPWWPSLGVARADDPAHRHIPDLQVPLDPRPLLDVSSTTPPVLTRYSISEAAAKAAPAVVQVVVASDKRPAASIFHRRFTGSGFIYEPSGYILTNAHVVTGHNEDGSRLLVTLTDGRVFEGRVVSMDKLSDLAVVKVDAGGEAMPTARLGNSARLRVGEWVIAVGSPLLLKHSVTAGIVSCVERKGAELGLLSAPTDYIQTDAAVNQGNSGGPLINLDGEVIGINNMKAVAADGVSFAIPIDTAKTIVAQLAAHGRVLRPYIGISMLEVGQARMKQMRVKLPGLPEAVTEGIFVPKVHPGSPAAKAGLQPDDIIVAAGQQPCGSTSQLVATLTQHIGKPVDITVVRKTEGRYERFAVAVTPDEAPPPA